MSSVAAAPQVAAPEETLSDLLEDGLFIDGDWIESKDQDPDGDVRLIQLADVGDGAFRNRSSRFLTMAKAKELRCTFLQAGDILVARMPEPLGRACIFPDVGQPAVTAVDVCILRPNPDRARPEWLVKAINSPEFRSSMQEFVRGTTRQRISRKNLGTLRLTVPGVGEQLALADLLERVESKRVAAAEHVMAARKTIERFRQVVLAAACSGRLTSEWRKSEGQESSGVPKGWRVIPLGEIAERVTKGTTPTSYGHKFTEAGVSFIKVENLRDGLINRDSGRSYISETTHQTQTRSILREGDVLFSIAGTIGRTAIVRAEDLPANTNQALAIIRGTSHLLTPDYLVVALQSAVQGAAADAARGSGMNNISLADVKRFQLAVPPESEQAEIVRRVDRLLALADGLGQRIEVAATRIDRSSQAVLAKAFRGDLLPLALTNAQD